MNIVGHVIMGIVVCAYIAGGAARMGYSRLVWFTVALFAGPVFALALLPSLPNRALERQRADERTRLAKELERARRQPDIPGERVPHMTLSEERTIRD
jgi:hypothetical protein